MFDELSARFEDAVKGLRGEDKISEDNVDAALKQVRRALLEADVNFKTAKDFTNKIKDKAIGQKVLTSLKPGQLLIKIVKDELTQLMGSNTQEIDLSSNPSSPTMLSKSLARSRAAFMGRPRISAGSCTFSNMRLHFKRSGCWKTIPTSRLGSNGTFSLPIKTCPFSWGCNPASTFNNVDFPQPDGPTRLTSSPS